MQEQNEKTVGVIKRYRNFMSNPFDKLSTIEALEKAREIYRDNSIEFDELQVRRIQFKNTQPKAYSIAKKEKLIQKWKGLEMVLAE